MNSSIWTIFELEGRSPHGERGLKWLKANDGNSRNRSLSSWRAWIEMHIRASFRRYDGVALLMESVD